MVSVRTNSAEETEKIGEKLAEHVSKGGVIAMFGGMGMGKTAFVRGLARALGVHECVTSPTFAIVNEYEGRVKLYHFDMYRITGLDDLYSTGYFDYLYTGGVLAVEWSENIIDALPEDYIKVSFSKGENDNSRIIEIENVGIDKNAIEVL